MSGSKLPNASGSITLAVGTGEADSVGLADGVGSTDGEGLGAGVSVGAGVPVGAGLGEGVSLADGEGYGSGGGENFGDFVGEGSGGQGAGYGSQMTNSPFGAMPGWSDEPSAGPKVAPHVRAPAVTSTYRSQEMFTPCIVRRADPL